MIEILSSRIFIALVSLLSVIGVFATFTFFMVQTKQRAKDLEQRSKDQLWLVNLAKTLETRYLGDFPVYLPDVAKLLSNATSSVKIMAMICSHGSFTDDRHWKEIRHVLRENISEKAEQEKIKSVEVLYCSRASLEASAQFYTSLTDEGWRNWRESNLTMIVQFLVRYYKMSANQAENIPNKLYRECRYFEHIRTCLDVYGSFKKFRCGERLPIYCWIVDDCKAIFAVATENNLGRYHGSGIYTEDAALVSSLRAMFEYYRDARSKEVEPDRLENYAKAELKFRLETIAQYKHTVI